MNTRYLVRPEGRLAYEVAGPDVGPLVVCLPGMGELRSSYRAVVPLLVAAGHRVATLDLRGHGDSDATFSAYDDAALADDLRALVAELGGPALVLGNSMGAGAAVVAAAAEPAAFTGLVLLGPFVRDPAGSALTTALFRAALLRPWGPSVFMTFHAKWFPGEKPAGYAEHRAAVRDNLRRPGHWAAFSRTTRTSHAPAEAALGAVACPAVVVMGEADIDWPDPAAEAAWVGEQLGAEVVLLPGVGHYPQEQAPQAVADAVARLVARA